MGSHKVMGKGYGNIENSQMASIGAIFTSKYQTKQLKPWPTHQPVMELSTASCLLVKGRRSHLKNTRALVDFRQASEIIKPQQKQLGKL